MAFAFPPRPALYPSALGRSLMTAADIAAACKALGIFRVLAHSAVGLSYTGGTSEQTLAAVTLPIMGLNAITRVWSTWSVSPANANTKTPKIRLGGVSGALVLNAGLTTSPLSFNDVRDIQNKNSVSSQLVKASGSTSVTGPTGVGVSSLAVNTGVAQDLVFQCQLAVATDTITLESYTVEFLDV